MRTTLKTWTLLLKVLQSHRILMFLIGWLRTIYSKEILITWSQWLTLLELEMCCIYVARLIVGLKRLRLLNAYLEMESQVFLLWKDFWRCEKNKSFSLHDFMLILIDLFISTWLHLRNQSFENRTSLEKRLKLFILLYSNQQLERKYDIDLSVRIQYFLKLWVGLTLNKLKFSLTKSIRILFHIIF